MKLQDAFCDYVAESELFVRRVLISFIGILLLTGMLIANLYNLQIVCFTDYQTRSNENRIKLIPIAPSRGIIYDRNGTPLALNRINYRIELIPEKVNNVQATLEALRCVIDLNDHDIAMFKKERVRMYPFVSIPVKTNLTEVQIARFAVNQHRFPGVEMKGYKCRYYPFGSALTHVIGYVSKINNKDIEYLNKEGNLSNYFATNDIGKFGIERYYEKILHGKIGYEEVEVNNHGRIIRRIKEVPPQAGRDVYLTLDLKLQQYIETLLIGVRAAVVITDPRTGDVLALVSMPSYDPNLFVNGISSKDYSSLLNDPNIPLINRATQGIYPPASTVKPYIAISALSTGVITKNTSLFDPGWWKLPGSEKRYRDWKKWGHGYLNVTKSIEESADTFFYQIAYDMGIDRLSEWMSKFGYGHYTGIDLSEECSGNMPTREWKKKRFKKPWYQGDTIPVGVGQGYWTATPLQMNKAMMTLINDGTVKIPHLLMNTIKDGKEVPWIQPYKSSISNIHPDYWEIVKDGMYGVANRPNGTAHQYFSSATYKIAAKSGTAQVFSLKANETYDHYKIAEHLRDHKLMIAYAPYDNPKVSVVMILENGGVGISIGTIMRQILDHIMLNDDNIKIPTKKPVIAEIEEH